MLINHTLGQNFSFVATPVVNNVEKESKTKLRLTDLESRCNRFTTVGSHSLQCVYNLGNNLITH